MIRREYTADDIAAYEITPGKGYDRVATEAFRQTALTAIRTLEQRLERANAEALAVNVSTSDPDVSDIARSLSKEELEQAGLMAIGLELVEARAHAEQKRSEANRHALAILAQVRDRLRAAAAQIDAGRNPSLSANQLRLDIGQAIEALGLPAARQAPQNPSSPATTSPQTSSTKLYR